MQRISEVKTGPQAGHCLLQGWAILQVQTGVMQQQTALAMRSVIATIEKRRLKRKQ
jgi:hypothetical protein